MANKPKCVRCESLERKQASKELYNIMGVTLCSVCIGEIHDDMMFSHDNLDDDEQGSEDLD